MGHLANFYDEVISCLRPAEAILLFGPGEAKDELRKRLERDKLDLRITRFETSDKMTERAQIQRHLIPSLTWCPCAWRIRGCAGVPNLSWRDASGCIRHNATAPWISDLEALPVPDFTLADGTVDCVIGRRKTVMVQTSRGCPSTARSASFFSHHAACTTRRSSTVQFVEVTEIWRSRGFWRRPVLELLTQ